jgi:hypothetical protein
VNNDFFKKHPQQAVVQLQNSAGPGGRLTTIKGAFCVSSNDWRPELSTGQRSMQRLKPE